MAKGEYGFQSQPCPDCGAFFKIETGKNQDSDEQWRWIRKGKVFLRTWACKNCGGGFKTVEIKLDEFERLEEIEAIQQKIREMVSSSLKPT